MPSYLLKPSRAARLAAALVVLLVPLRLAAQELSFHEPSARAASLGGAFTARSDDTTALFGNPAGLAFQGGFRFKTDIAFGKRGITAGWPDGGQTFRTEPNEFTGNLALSWQPLGRVTVAVGAFSPYNFDSYWTPGWDAETVVTRNRLRALSLRAAVAVAVFKGLALAAGVDYVSSDLWYRHLIPFNVPSYPQPRDIDVESSHDLHGSGLGFTAGVLWKVLPVLQIGARYKQEVGVDFSGSNVFVQPMDVTGASVPRPGGGSIQVYDLINLYYADQDVTGRLTFPREIAAGVAFTPVSRLSLTVDVQWDTWTGFGDWIFTSVNEGGDLNPAFPPAYQEFYGLPLDYGVQGVPLALGDTKKIKAGLEYRPAQYLAVRAGFAKHQSSVDEAGRTPVYPDLDRDLYSLGFGYEGPLFSIWGDGEKVSDLSFDLFIRYAAAGSGPSAYPGFEMTYDSSRLTFGIGAGFIF